MCMVVGVVRALVVSGCLVLTGRSGLGVWDHFCHVEAEVDQACLACHNPSARTWNLVACMLLNVSWSAAFVRFVYVYVGESGAQSTPRPLLHCVVVCVSVAASALRCDDTLPHLLVFALRRPNPDHLKPPGF